MAGTDEEQVWGRVEARARWRRLGLVAAALGVVVGGGAVVAVLRPSVDSRGGAGPRAAQEAEVRGRASRVEHPDWSSPGREAVAVPAAPVGSASGLVTSLGDGRFLLYGGGANPPDFDQAPPQVFDASDGSWTVVPPEPFDDRVAAPVGIAVGGGFLAIGTRCADERPDPGSGSGEVLCAPGTIETWRYDLAADRWSEVEVPEAMQTDEDDPPSSAHVLASDPVTGDALVQVAEGVWRYAAAGDRWLPAPDLPSGSNACATTSGFVAVATPDQNMNVGGGNEPTVPTAWTLDGDREWVAASTIPLLEEPTESWTIPICTEGGALAMRKTAGGEVLGAAWFEAGAGSWSTVDAPRSVGIGRNSATVAGGAVLTVAEGLDAGPTVRFDEADGTWSDANPSVEPVAVFTADRSGLLVARPFDSERPGQLVAIRVT